MENPGKPRPLNLNIQEAGTHYFGDACPPTFNLNRATDLFRLVSIYSSVQIPATRYLGKLGLPGLSVPFQAMAAQAKLREYIKACGSEQVALSEFRAPGVFDQNRFNPGTIIKIEEDLQARASRFDYDKTMVSRYCHRHKVTTEHPRGWIEQDIPVPKFPSSFLGVIWKIPGIADHVILYFDNDQPKILSRPALAYINRPPVSLSQETHFSVTLRLIDMVGFKIDTIMSVSKIEVLAIGKGSRGGKRIPAERSVVTARPLSYSPI